MVQLTTAREAAQMVKDGMTVMVGGFMAVGTPESLVTELVELGPKSLTLISNDTAFPDRGVGRMVSAKQFERIYASHIGTNPETQRQLNTQETEVHLVPQGTLAEKVRCGGAGIGGFLTPTGVGTVVADGKQVINVDGRDFLLETPLKAHVALIKAYKADKAGNLVYRGTARNFNPLMAMAAETVIVEVEELVEVGEIGPDEVMTPGIFVDYIVKGE